LVLTIPFIYITTNKQKFYLAIYIIGFLISQIVIASGIIAISQMRFGLNWFIDLGTLLGMFVGVVVSLSQYILACQKHFKGKTHDIKVGNWKVASASATLDIVAFVLAFVTLFTPFRGLGLTFILFIIIENLLTKNLLRSSF